MNLPLTQRLLDRVAVRHFVALLAKRFHRVWIMAAGAALALVCLARLLSLIPAGVMFIGLGALAAAPVLFALLATRRPQARQAARLIDERMGSKELFLTAALIEQSPADFQAIVVEQAEKRAGDVEPARVVPFQWQRGVRDVVGSLALIAVAVLFLPQLDPFKQQEQRDKFAKQREQLEQTKKATATRAEQIKEGDNRESEAVKKALAALETTFKQARPLEKEANLQRLAEQQKQLGELWRQAANQQRNDAFEKGAQQFGAVNPQRAQQWRDELKKGDVSAIQKELQAMREEMKKLAGMPDSAEKRAAQEQLAQRLNSLADGMKQAANSPQMQAALQRAMQQLDLAKLGNLSKEGLQAAQESLNLSEQELQQLAQSMKDLQNLEDGLKNLQMAKQLAGQCKLDGEGCKDCNGMGDYAALYDKLLNNKTGSGPGMGPNPGQGSGGKASENDDAETAFKPEKSPTQLAGGKMLLQWKVDEVGPTGARAEDYRDAVRQVKQGVSEAIANEQVPPGYHQAIQKYFDTLSDQ
jgi:hypothetical protein